MFFTLRKKVLKTVYWKKPKQIYIFVLWNHCKKKKTLEPLFLRVFENYAGHFDWEKKRTFQKKVLNIAKVYYKQQHEQQWTHRESSLNPLNFNRNSCGALLRWRPAWLSQLKRACDHILAPQERLSLDPQRSLQIRNLEVQHVDVRGAEPRAHAHSLVHVELDQLVPHQWESPQKPKAQLRAQPLLLFIWGGGGAQSDEAGGARVESAAVGLRSSGQPQDAHWSLHTAPLNACLNHTHITNSPVVKLTPHNGYDIKRQLLFTYLIQHERIWTSDRKSVYFQNKSNQAR